MIFKKIFYRLYQGVLLNIMQAIKYNSKVISKKGAVYYIPAILKKQHITRVLVVTGPHIVKSGLFQKILCAFKDQGLSCRVFNKVSPETGIKSVEDMRRIYMESRCNAIIAIGGGSVIDCAKAAAGGIANPGRSIRSLSGYQKVKGNSLLGNFIWKIFPWEIFSGRKLPVTVAVPTTAGTGAEATACAVIKDVDGSKKIIADTCIAPRYAVLDPLMTQDLPKVMVAYTGMDALTHATEAYINRYSSKNSRKDAKMAVRLIASNITSVYYGMGGTSPRKNMLEASYLAGRAFMRASVGYVHAISHAIGGRYNLPHGMVVAAVLPYVLEWYGSCIDKKLASLSDAAGVSAKYMSVPEKAQAYINYIKMLNHRFGINTNFYNALIKEMKKGSNLEKEVKNIAKCAIIESNPHYPVPKIMSLPECEKLVYRLIGNYIMIN